MNDLSPAKVRLEISMDDQILDVFSDGKKVQSFPISTSEKGMGFSEGSFRTPTGNFLISEKIGAGEPLGTIFKARKPIGLFEGSDSCDEDFILTRILRLEGTDPENKNSAERYIYIHGTNQENKIGQPASHGCIRLRNVDMAALFELVDLQAELVIHPLTKKRGKLLFIDCDSTLSSIEGIDELARLANAETFAEVVKLTNAAMNGEVPLDEVFSKRMEIIKPSFNMVQEVSQSYIEHIVPGVVNIIEYARNNGWLPVIISGGFEPIIRPLAKYLGIKHVEAVPLYFDESGDYCGYGEDYPTTRNLGKNEIIQEWKNALLPERVIMIGDGISDLETKPDVDVMVGFGGVVSRDKVKASANIWLTDFENSEEFLLTIS